MRFALIIVCLTSIAVARVHLRRAELVARHDAQELANRQIELRRALWDQQVRMGYLTAPAKVRRQVLGMATERPGGSADRAAPAPQPSGG